MLGLKIFFAIFLGGLFVYACSESFASYTLGEVGVAMKTEESSSFDFPTLTFCGLRSINSSDINITKAYQNSLERPFLKGILHQLTENVTITHVPGVDGGIGQDAEIENSLMIDADETFKTISTCVSYTPQKQTRIGFKYAAYFLVDMSELHFLTISVSPPNLTFNTDKDILGKTVLLIGKEVKPIRMDDVAPAHSFAMNRKVITEVSSHRKPCSKNTSPKEFNTCLHSWMERQVGCKLPWNSVNLSLRACLADEDYEKFLTFFQELSESGELKLLKKSECEMPCKLRTFDVKRQFYDTMHTGRMNRSKSLGQSILTTEEPLMICFFVPTSQVTVIDSYFIHGFSKVLADAGSFMGLLLGYSAKSVIDFIIDWAGVHLISTRWNKL